jgi:hypothetical protein
MVTVQEGGKEGKEGGEIFDEHLVTLEREKGRGGREVTGESYTCPRGGAKGLTFVNSGH